MIKAGSIINLPITIHDVYRAFRIYGQDIASLKGKTKLKTPVVIKPEFIPRPLRSAQVMHLDVMFVNRDPFLLTVSSPLGLTIATHLNGSASSKNILNAIKDQVNIYKVENFIVDRILTDGASAMVTLLPELQDQGIRVEVCGTGQHVPIVENKIRQVKERVRSHVTTLPYLLPKLLMKWLVFFCVMRLNMLPNKSRTDGVLSPIELFKGRKVDYKRDVRIGFGEYVQAINPNIVPRNSMAPRTDGAIALMPTGNMQGSVKFYSLSTNRIITRDHWIVLPVPQLVIDHMNYLAQKHSDGGDPDVMPKISYGKIENIVQDDYSNDNYNDIIEVEDERASNVPTKLSGDGSGDIITHDMGDHNRK
jgi:hypothetical protein